MSPLFIKGKSTEILESVAPSLFTLMIKHYQLKSENLTNHSSDMNFDSMIFICKTLVVNEKRWF